MRSFLKITALLLLLLRGAECFGQDQTYKLEDLFQVKPGEAKTKKIKSCSSVIYYSMPGDTSCSYGDYFAFDTSGRVVGHMICSDGGSPNSVTYTYDPSTNKLIETREYKTFINADYPMSEASEIEARDRDAMLHNSRLETTEIWRNGEKIQTTYYDEKGKVEWQMYPVFDKNDSIVQVRWVETGVLREVWVYRPNGKLLADTSFDKYEGMVVETFDEYGHQVAQTNYDTNGVIWHRETTEYKYDSNGRELDKVEKNNEGKTEKHTATTYDTKGKIASIVITNDTGLVTRNYLKKVQVVKGDTIITEQSMYYFRGEKRYSFNNTMHRIMPLTHSVEKTVVEYKTDAHKNIIGDTTKEYQVTVYNESGDVVSVVNKVNGVEKFTISITYDSPGHPLESVRTGRDRPGKETFTYYPNGTLKTYTHEELGSVEVIAEEAWGNIETTTYNSDGKIVQVSKGTTGDPQNHVVSYTYDANGLLIRKEITQGGKRSVLTTFKYTFY